MAGPSPQETDGPADGSAAAQADETALIAGLKRGDNAAFERLVREHGPRLLAVTRRIARDDSDSQDALQEAFVTVFRRIEQFDGRSRLHTWLHRVAVNAALMKLRKRKRLAEQSIDDLLPKFSWIGYRKGPSDPWRSPPDDQAARQETRRIVLERIAELPETHRDVLLMRDIDELSTDQTATALGIRPGAVKTRLHRARQALRELLHEHMQEDRG
jgi:RNA polymerase sigma-70 factor (ECF subfamily)